MGAGTSGPRLVVASVVALVATALGSPAASAATAPVGVTVRDAVLYAGCFRHPVAYRVDVDGSWRLDLVLYGPAGSVRDRVRVTGAGPSTAQGAVALCASAYRPGTYRVTARLTTEASTATASDAFRLVRPTSRVSLRVSPRRPRPGQRVVLRASATVARPLGQFPRAGLRVKAYVRRDGHWRRVGPVARTRADGTATVRVRLRGSHARKVRVVVARSRDHERARSRTVSVRPRPPSSAGKRQR